MNEFEQIFLNYSPIVYRFLLSLCSDAGLADELTAETFYQAYLHLAQFRGECKIETWLCQIAKNALYKELKKRKRHSELKRTHFPSSSDNLFSSLCDRESSLEIRCHLHALSEPYREVFMLRVFGELSFRDIARICGKTESWAKVTFYRAKDKIIKAMEEKHEY